MARRHSVGVLLRLTPQEASLVDEVANAHGLTRTEVLRILIQHAPRLVTTPPRLAPRETAENAATGPK